MLELEETDAGSSGAWWVLLVLCAGDPPRWSAPTASAMQLNPWSLGTKQESANWEFGGEVFLESKASSTLKLK